MDYKKGTNSQKVLELKIAKLMHDEWPKHLTQEAIKEKLGLKNQSEVAKILSEWKKRKKEDVPIKYVFQGMDLSKDVKLEQMFKTNYNIENPIVIDTNKRINSESYYSQIGKYASGLIMQEINNILDKKSGEPSIRICTSCGNNVYSTVLSLAEELEGTVTRILFSSCITLRSDKIVEMSPLNIVAQLSNRKVNIDVIRTYQLPELDYNYSDRNQLYKSIENRMAVRNRLKLNDQLKCSQNDIIIFGIGNIDITLSSNDRAGFMNHIEKLNLHSLCKKLNLCGEFGFAPFSANGFLFHHLVHEVFVIKNNKFKYNEEEQLERLKKFAPGSDKIVKQDLFDAAKLFNSIFTLDYCEFDDEHYRVQNRKPYIILVVGGEQAKAEPIKMILEKWKKYNIINGIVTSTNIANKIFSQTK